MSFHTPYGGAESPKELLVDPRIDDVYKHFTALLAEGQRPPRSRFAQGLDKERRVALCIKHYLRSVHERTLLKAHTA